MSTHTTATVEALMLHAFRTEPFHNLRLMYNDELGEAVPGGTCSDKTMSFVQAARQSGLTVALHSAFVGGEEIHRLVRVELGDRIYFADVGNGWPSVRLYPTERPTEYNCFGMTYRTEVTPNTVSVYHHNKGRESLQMEIPVFGRPESEILAAIKMRFRSGITYPFSNAIRFSAILGDRFLFLRGEHLEIYTHTGLTECLAIASPEVPVTIRDYFGYDLTPYLARKPKPDQYQQPTGMLRYINGAKKMFEATNLRKFSFNRMPLSSNAATKLLKKMFQDAGVGNASSHSMRRTHEDDLRRNGADLKLIQDQLGHANIQTTAIYFGISDEERKNAIRGMRFKI